MTRQAFYKRDEEALYRRLAIEQFVKQFVLEVREQDPRIGADKLWRMYQQRFSEEYRVGRDIFRSILHERGLNIRRRLRATRTTDSRHHLYCDRRPRSPAWLPFLLPDHHHGRLQQEDTGLVRGSHS